MSERIIQVQTDREQGRYQVDTVSTLTIFAESNSLSFLCDIGWGKRGIKCFYEQLFKARDKNRETVLNYELVSLELSNSRDKINC